MRRHEIFAHVRVTLFAGLTLFVLWAGPEALRPSDIIWCPITIPGVPCLIGGDKDRPKPPAPAPPPKCPPPPKPRIELQPCHDPVKA